MLPWEWLNKCFPKALKRKSIIQLLQVSIADTQMQQVTAMNLDYPAAYSYNTLYSVYLICQLCQHSWEMLILAATAVLFCFYILPEF